MTTEQREWWTFPRITMRVFRDSTTSRRRCFLRRPLKTHAAEASPHRKRTSRDLLGEDDILEAAAKRCGTSVCPDKAIAECCVFFA